MTDRICVVGAGPAGIVTSKVLGERGVPHDVLEAEDGIGGTWAFGSRRSPLYETTHLITSTKMTQFAGVPFPAGTPDFPRHDQALAYLRRYADDHGVTPRVTTGAEVVKAERQPGGERGWTVTTADGTERAYAGVVVANGHNWDPRLPAWPSDGSVPVIHSRDYRTPRQLQGKRVLVVGGGNSGFDIASDAATAAGTAFFSVRRGYHIFPKLVMGRPVDQVAETPHKLRLPLPARRLMGGLLIRTQVGDYRDYGLPRPDHKMYEGHITLNSRLLYHLRHGDVTVRPDVRAVRGGAVEFADGSREDLDLVIAATGYRLTVPFLDPALLNWHQGDRPDLLLQVAHPHDPSLYVAGLVQTDAGVWPLIELQAELLARLLLAERHDRGVLEWFRGWAPAQQPAAIGYLDTPRHHLEVEHASYTRLMRRALRRLDRRLGADRHW